MHPPYRAQGLGHALCGAPAGHGDGAPSRRQAGQAGPAGLRSGAAPGRARRRAPRRGDPRRLPRGPRAGAPGQGRPRARAVPGDHHADQARLLRRGVEAILRRAPVGGAARAAGRSQERLDRALQGVLRAQDRARPPAAGELRRPRAGPLRALDGEGRPAHRLGRARHGRPATHRPPSPRASPSPRCATPTARPSRASPARRCSKRATPPRPASIVPQRPSSPGPPSMRARSCWPSYPPTRGSAPSRATSPGAHGNGGGGGPSSPPPSPPSPPSSTPPSSPPTGPQPGSIGSHA